MNTEKFREISHTIGIDGVKKLILKFIFDSPCTFRIKLDGPKRSFKKILKNKSGKIIIDGKNVYKGNIITKNKEKDT